MDNFKELAMAFADASIACQADEPLAKHTSFKIGGNCRLLVQPKSKEEVVLALRLCRENGVSFLILGNGSNVLVSDDGFDGVVILLNNRFAAISMVDETTVKATAGVSLMRLCQYACEQGLTGLEFAYGIPATVGGAIYMNAGAYGGEMKDVLQCAEHVDEKGVLGSFAGDDLALSYRHSAYTDSPYCILSGTFRLQKGDPKEIRAKMDDIMGRRKSKQPLEYPSAGSTFKRPLGAYAAQLIEECGLKGLTVGGAQVSQKHSGFLINVNHATCADVKALIAKVQEEVYRQRKIALECEVKFIDS